jgi:large subunit ribosomal protein L15
MKLNDLKPAMGSKTKAFRKGRGTGSGNGKTSGRGHKGQRSRSGGRVKLGFEGGQMPLYRKVPKRGFKNPNFKQYAIVNIRSLDLFNDGDVVDFSTLKEKGLVSKKYDGLKILGDGTITKKLYVHANLFSKHAKELIEAVGGKTKVV